MAKLTKIILVIISVAFYTISLNQKCIGNFGGMECLMFGPISSYVTRLPFGTIAWLSNIIYFHILLRMIFLPKQAIHRVFFIILLVLACSSFFVREILVNEGDTFEPMKIHIGLYYWILSFALITLANEVFTLFGKNRVSE